MKTLSHSALPLAMLCSLGLLMTACKENPDDPKPRPVAAFTATPGACQGNCPVAITNSSQNATRYSWDFGDGNTSTQADAQFTHNFATSGRFRVKLRVEGDGGVDTTSRVVQVGSGSGCTYSVVPVTNTISTPTTWQSCKVYVVGPSVGVSSILTIQPGAIVKFQSNAGLTLLAGGRIDAAGTAAEPVVFTSVMDDAHGGDSNNDGTATTPTKRSWNHVGLNGQSGSRFEHCLFKYAGASAPNTALDLFGAAATVRNCTFVRNGGGAPSFKGALHAGNALANTVIEGNIFYLNEMPLRVVNLFSLDNSNKFANPNNPNEKNDRNAIWVDDAPGVSTTLTWAESDVPFVVENLSVDAPMTLEPGVVVKLGDNAQIALTASIGRLLARGNSTQPIVFTSIHDDATGGDTNGNGTGTSPARRDWRSIVLTTTTGSVFEYCRFLYGGAGGTTLSLHGASAAVRNCTFAHNGEDVANATRAALDARDAAGGTVIQSNTFFDNVRPLSVSSNIDIDNSNAFQNPANAAQKNVYQGIVVEWNNNVTKPNVVWGETELAFVNLTNIDLPDNNTLALADNVVLKFNAGVQITLRGGVGQLINHSNPGVRFTSVKDDSVGGDSNGNGAANGPAVNDWRGIYVNSQPGVWLRWSNIYFQSN